MNIYTDGNGPWLQSETRQSFASGLITITQEYAILRGSTSPFTVGDVLAENYKVFPDPVISRNANNAFDTLTLTGYGIAENVVQETLLSYTTGTVDARSIRYINTGAEYFQNVQTGTASVIFDIGYCKIMREKGTDTLPSAPALSVRSINGSILTELAASAFTWTDSSAALGSYMVNPRPVEFTTQITNISVRNFGEVEEVEVIYSIVSATAGVFQEEDPNFS